MKHINKFEEFRVNEELSMKAPFILLSSMLLTFNTIAGGFGGHGPSISKDKVKIELSIIDDDLTKLKNQIKDDVLIRLASRVQNLKDVDWKAGSPEKIPAICDEILALCEKYQENKSYWLSDITKNIKDTSVLLFDGSNKYYDKEDMLDLLEKLNADQKDLLTKYEEAKEQNTDASLYMMYLFALLLIIVHILVRTIKNR